MFRRSGRRFADKNMRKVAPAAFAERCVRNCTDARPKPRVFAMLFTISLPFAAPR
jgi:hypothetical protein